MQADEPAKTAEDGAKKSEKKPSESVKTSDGSAPKAEDATTSSAKEKKGKASTSASSPKASKTAETVAPKVNTKPAELTSPTESAETTTPTKSAEPSDNKKAAAATSDPSSKSSQAAIKEDGKKVEERKLDSPVFVGPQLKKPLARSDRGKQIKRLLAINMRKAKYRRIVEKFYKSRNYELVFHSGDAPDARARYFVDELADLDSHGISSRIFWVFGPKARKQGILWSRRTSPWYEPELEVPKKLSDLVLQDLLLTDALFAYIKRFKFNRSKNGMYNLSVYTLDSKYAEEMMTIARDILVDVKKGLRALWPITSKYNELRKHLKTYQALTKENRQ